MELRILDRSLEKEGELMEEGSNFFLNLAEGGISARRGEICAAGAVKGVVVKLLLVLKVT